MKAKCESQNANCTASADQPPVLDRPRRRSLNWDAGKPARTPCIQFVYEGTQDAVTPGSKLRIYLKWNAKHKSYERVHFNSGFVVLEKSAGAYPTLVGVPRFATIKRAEPKAAANAAADPGKSSR